MTTVVANLEAMAADHRCTSEGPICHVKKIYRLTVDGEERLYGLCGEVMMALYVIEWLQGKRDKEALHKAIGIEQRANIALLELSHDGLALIDGWGMRMPLLDRCYAIGSGAGAAIVSLRRGAELRDCIRDAAAIDEASGTHPDFPPELEYLTPKELTPKRRRGK